MAAPLTAHTKITQLHLAIRVDEDIRGLHVAMQNPLLVAQVREADENLVRNLAQYILRHATYARQHRVQRPTILR